MKGNSNNSILQKNEKEANYFAAKIMRITAAFYVLVLVLNLTGIFVIKQSLMITAFVIGMVLLLLPTLFINVLKLEHPIIKYICVFCAIIFVSVTAMILTFHVVIVYIYGIAIASVYFSKKLSYISVVGSVVFLALAQVLSYSFETIGDENFLTLSEAIIYCILPRTLELFAIAAIFISLNTRTTKMLASVMGAEEQKKMVNHLSKMKAKSLEVSETLSDTVTTLSQVTENTSDVNRMVTENTEKVTNGSAKNVAHLEDAAENVTKISENLKTLAEESEQIKSISSDVTELANTNEKIMNVASEGMKQISQSTEECKNIISQLESQSKQIIQIIEVITSISKQTNLLALNASIESARAGEQGKGFAVVADEIRKLAEQTQSAVGNIGNIIYEVVENTNEAVKAMQINSELTENGQKAINQAEEATTKISSSTETMNSKLIKLNEITKDVSARGVNVAETVAAVKEISSKNLLELQSVASVTVNENKSLEELAELVKSISQIADDLNEVVQNG